MARILVIENDSALRAVVRQFLDEAGHDILEAEDGAAGMALFRADPVDLIITDLLMPNKEGIETILDLRRQAPDVRIIAMSGAEQAGGVDLLGYARKLGASHSLKKPFRRRALLDAVAAALQN